MGVASPQTCRPGPKNFWFGHSIACNKVLIMVRLIFCLFVFCNFFSLWTGTIFRPSLKKSGRNFAYLRPASYCFMLRYEYKWLPNSEMHWLLPSNLHIYLSLLAPKGKITALDCGSIDKTSLLGNSLNEGEILNILVCGSVTRLIDEV